MAQVNFYTLNSQQPEARLQFACRLTEKARSLGHRVFIQTESSHQAKLLDEMLWQFTASSFVPHALQDSGSSGDDCVTIGTNPRKGNHDDVLINLAPTASEAHGQFSRINEIISNDEDSLQQGRLRYRYYKEQGYQPETFKL